MHLTIGVVTDGRWDDMERFVDTYNERTCGHDKHEFILIDNANFDSVDMAVDWMPRFKTKDKRLIVNEKREACAHNWNELVKAAKYDMVVIVNDDSYFLVDDWDLKLAKAAVEKTDFRIFFLCQPNSFSGFSVYKDFWWQVGGMREEYITAGLEDEDFWLMMQKTLGYTESSQLLEKVAYSFPRRDVALIRHIPYMTSKYRRAYWMKDRKNVPVFKKFWKQLSGSEWTAIRTMEPTAEVYGKALEGKAGCRYVYIGPEDRGK